MPSIFAPLPLVRWQPRGNYRVNVWPAAAVAAQGLVWKVVPAAELEAETQSLAERLAVHVFILPPFLQSPLRSCNAVKTV
jgi:enoyl-CoA hydratase/carnithine racemase